MKYLVTNSIFNIQTRFKEYTRQHKKKLKKKKKTNKKRSHAHALLKFVVLLKKIKRARKPTLQENLYMLKSKRNSREFI